MTKFEWAVGVGLCLLLLSPIWVPAMLLGLFVEEVKTTYA